MSNRSAKPLYRFSCDSEACLNVAQVIGPHRVRHVTKPTPLAGQRVWQIEVRCDDDREARFLAMGWAYQLLTYPAGGSSPLPDGRQLPSAEGA